MEAGKLLQDCFTTTGELNQNPAAILGRRSANDQFLRHQPVHQPNRTVVSQLQSFRQLAHRDAFALRKTLDRQQRLMLLRRDASGLRGCPAKMKELPERVSKRGERFILRFDQRFVFRHDAQV